MSDHFAVSTSHDANRDKLPFLHFGSTTEAYVMCDKFNNYTLDADKFEWVTPGPNPPSGSHLEPVVTWDKAQVGEWKELWPAPKNPPDKVLGIQEFIPKKLTIKLDDPETKAIWDCAKGTPLKDLKEALSGGRKPDTTHIRTPMRVYGSRAGMYGDDKYERANYLRPAGDGLRGEFLRHRQYLRAAQDHIARVLDAMELHQSGDPSLLDEAGMRASVATPDLDETPGAKVGASKLPHHCGGVASLNFALAQAVQYGLLPADPGTPWRDK